MENIGKQHEWPESGESPSDSETEKLHKISLVFGTDAAEIITRDTELSTRVSQAFEDSKWDLSLVNSLYKVVGEYFDEVVRGLMEYYGIKPLTINRALGVSPEEEAGYLSARALYNWLNQKNEIIDGELEKTEREAAIINRAIGEVQFVVELYGGKVPDMGVDIVKIVEKNSLTKSGDWETMRHYARVARENNELSGFKTIVHELFHAGSFQSIHIDMKEKHLYSYRTGLSLLRRKEIVSELEPAFRVLNEAITEELARRVVVNISEDDEIFGELIRDRNDTISEYENRGEFDTANFLKSEYFGTMQDEQGLFVASSAGYLRERRHMRDLIDVILERDGFGSDIQNRDDAFGLLVKSYFSGDLITLARAMEKTFGESALTSYSECFTVEECEQWLIRHSESN